MLLAVVPEVIVGSLIHRYRHGIPVGALRTCGTTPERPHRPAIDTGHSGVYLINTSNRTTTHQQTAAPAPSPHYNAATGLNVHIKQEPLPGHPQGEHIPVDQHRVAQYEDT